MSVTEAYSVATRLTITGDATKKLSEFTRGVKRASEATETLLKRMRPLNDQFLKSSEILSKLNPRLTRFGETFVEVRGTLTRVNDSFTGLNRRLETSGARIESLTAKAGRLRHELAGLAGANDAVGTMPAGSGLRRSGGSKAKGHSSGGVHVKSAHLGAFGLSAPTLAAGAVGYGLYGAYEANKDYQQAYGKFKAMGLSDQDNTFADNYAKNVKIPGVTQTESMETLTDGMVVMGKLQEAAKFAPMLAKMKFSSETLFGKEVSNKQIQKAAAVIEQRGGFKSEQEAKTQMDYLIKAHNAEGGRVSYSENYNLMKYGGTMAQTQDNESFYFALEPLVQEANGSKVGTSLNMFGRAIIAGKMTKKAKDEFKRIGLVDDKGNIKGASLAQTNQLKWVKDYLLPAMREHGITTQNAQLGEVDKLFSSSSAGYIVTKDIIQMPKIEKQIEQYKRAKGLDEGYDQAINSITGPEKLFHQAYLDFMKTIGEITSPVVLNGMKALTDIMNGVTVAATGIANFLRDHPTIAKLLTSNMFNIAEDTLNAGKQVWADTAKGGRLEQESAARYSTVLPAGSGQRDTNLQVNVDGKSLFQIIMDRAGKQASKAPAYGASFDPSQSFTPVMLNR